jgi:hypothetical protein
MTLIPEVKEEINDSPSRSKRLMNLLPEVKEEINDSCS